MDSYGLLNQLFAPGLGFFKNNGLLNQLTAPGLGNAGHHTAKRVGFRIPVPTSRSRDFASSRAESRINAPFPVANRI